MVPEGGDNLQDLDDLEMDDDLSHWEVEVLVPYLQVAVYIQPGSAAKQTLTHLSSLASDDGATLDFDSCAGVLQGCGGGKE